MIDNIFVLLVFIAAVCGVLGLGAYITDHVIPRRRIKRRLKRLEAGS